MSASFQTLPNPGPPLQPGMVYPTTPTTTSSMGNDQNTAPDHSSGSFGMVFVVLAIILVVSAVACALGRFCGKKSDKSSKSKAHKQSKHSHGTNHNRNPNHNPNHNHMMNHHQANNHKSSNNHHHKQHGGGKPKDRDLEFGYRSKEGDIMMGFEPKARSMPHPSAKVAHNNGDFRVDSMGRGMESHHHHGNPRDFRVDSMGRGMEPQYHGNPRDFP